MAPSIERAWKTQYFGALTCAAGLSIERAWKTEPCGRVLTGGRGDVDTSNVQRKLATSGFMTTR